MAFKTDGLAKGYASAQQESIRVKAYATSTRASLIANTVSANAVIQVMASMKSSIDAWAASKSLPGMAQYAKDQEDDQAYDVVAEFTAMEAAAQACIDWVYNNFPKSVSGHIEKDVLETDGAITVRQFTPAQTTGLQVVLETLANAIE